MRQSRNKQSKKELIRFRNDLRKWIKYTKVDFATSRDPELNELANSFNIIIIKWSPLTHEALVCIYNSKKFPNGSINIHKASHFLDYDLKWVYYRSHPMGTVWELVNNYILRIRESTRERKAAIKIGQNIVLTTFYNRKTENNKKN